MHLIELIHRVEQSADLAWVRSGGRQSARRYTILRVVAEEDGISQNDITVRSGIDRSTTADLIKKMETAGLLKRQRGATDGRQRVVSITDKGRARLAEFASVSEAAETALLNCIPQRRRAEFLETLEALAKLEPLAEAKAA